MITIEGLIDDSYSIEELVDFLLEKGYEDSIINYNNSPHLEFYASIQLERKLKEKFPPKFQDHDLVKDNNGDELLILSTTAIDLKWFKNESRINWEYYVIQKSNSVFKISFIKEKDIQQKIRNIKMGEDF